VLTIAHHAEPGKTTREAAFASMPPQFTTYVVLLIREASHGSVTQLCKIAPYGFDSLGSLRSACAAGDTKRRAQAVCGLTTSIGNSATALCPTGVFELDSGSGNAPFNGPSRAHDEGS
jgi:hypothetical protein